MELNLLQKVGTPSFFIGRPFATHQRQIKSAPRTLYSALDKQKNTSE